MSEQIKWRSGRGRIISGYTLKLVFPRDSHASRKMQATRIVTSIKHSRVHTLVFAGINHVARSGRLRCEKKRKKRRMRRNKERGGKNAAKERESERGEPATYMHIRIYVYIYAWDVIHICVDMGLRSSRLATCRRQRGLYDLFEDDSRERRTISCWFTVSAIFQAADEWYLRNTNERPLVYNTYSYIYTPAYLNANRPGKSSTIRYTMRCLAN